MNGYFNNQSKSNPTVAKGGGGKPPARGSKSQPFREKPGFTMSNPLPGKAQKSDRSGGVKRAKVRPAETGL